MTEPMPGRTVLPLDTSQRAFCDESASHIRLLAPAGSGKTTSVLWRCLALSERSARESSRFLIFTFTRAARDELRDRLRTTSGLAAVAPNTEVSTLNAWGHRRLKSRVHNLQLLTASDRRHWTMSNALQPLWMHHPRLKAVLTDSRRKSRAIRDLMDLSDRLKSLGFRHDLHESLDQVTDHVDWLRTNGMGAHVDMMLRTLTDLEVLPSIALLPDKALPAFVEHYLEFWRDACIHMFQSGTITLEDQKYWSLIDVETQLADGKATTGIHRAHHVLVDEFQDINPLDLQLLRAVTEYNKAALCIVGDDDQAIYEWRGATPEFILSPDRHLGGTFATHILAVNYRSPANIVEASQRLIAHNERRVAKNVSAASSERAHIAIHRVVGVQRAIDVVVAEVQRCLEDPSIGSIALVGRKRSQIIPYQIVFASMEIPFFAAEDLQVFLSGAFNELKGLLLTKAQATLAFPLGPDPVEALLRMCDKVKRYPLSKADRQALKSHLLGARPKTVVEALERLYSYNGPLKGAAEGGATAQTFYEAIRSVLLSDTVADALRAISGAFAGLQKDYGKSLDDIFYADPPFLYLADYAERYSDDFGRFYEDLDKAVATLARVPPDDEDEKGDQRERKHPLHLMTALRAKGKEFDSVVILDCNRGIWPSKLAQTAAEHEAERRLFYVAMTRSRRRLSLVVNDTLLGEAAVASPYLAEAGLSSDA